MGEMTETDFQSLLDEGGEYEEEEDLEEIEIDFDAEEDFDDERYDEEDIQELIKRRRK